MVSVALALALAFPALGASVFTTRLDDPQAVYLSAEAFGAHANGQADDSAPIQAAIDKAGANPLGGIVFVPVGRYRLSHTIFVWTGVRVIGYGATRPIFVLADNTPGFQRGVGVMVLFTRAHPGDAGRMAGHVPFPPPGIVPPNTAIPDADPGTFYSALSNIDFEIGKGNPAAIAIRFHAAQHAYLSHIDFHIGSGLTALTEIGNEAEDLQFYGGRYGILTEKPSPAWQFTLWCSAVPIGARCSSSRTTRCSQSACAAPIHDSEAPRGGLFGASGVLAGQHPDLVQIAVPSGLAVADDVQGPAILAGERQVLRLDRQWHDA